MIEGSFLLMKTFNINASCNTDIHYMADITPGLEIIKSMVDREKYFVTDRGRQYGKTTTLHLLETFLEKDYFVLNLDW